MATNEVTLLLVGNTGNGKSATGNSILRQQVFKTSASTSSTKSDFAIESNIFNNVKLNVVDCPGVNTDKSAEDFLNESIETIKQALKLCDYKFTALLIVVKYGARFTKQESDFIKSVKGILGKNVIKDFGVCIMTHGDNFEADNEDENLSFKDWCQEQQGDIKKLIQECNDRCILFNNRIKEPSLKDSQVSELMAMVPRNVHYTAADFNAADTDLKKLIIETKMPRILKETNDYLNGKRNKIKTILSDKDIDKQIQSYKDILNQVNEFEHNLLAEYQGPENIQQPLNGITIFKMDVNIKLKQCEQKQQMLNDEQLFANLNRSEQIKLTPDSTIGHNYGDEEVELGNQESWEEISSTEATIVGHKYGDEEVELGSLKSWEEISPTLATTIGHNYGEEEVKPGNQESWEEISPNTDFLDIFQNIVGTISDGFEWMRLWLMGES